MVVFSSRIKVRGEESPLTSYIRILGGFPFDSSENIRFKLLKFLEDSKIRSPDKNITISYIHEPLTFLNNINNDQPVSWFSFLHDSIKRLNIEPSKIYFLTSNVYASESYNLWCKQFGIDKKINVVSQKKEFWISKVIANNFLPQSINEDKHFSLFIGRPNFQKNEVVKWYLECMFSNHQDKFISTFLYPASTIPEHWSSDLKDKAMLLPGTIEDNSKSHPDTAALPWGGDSDIFSKAFSRGLINFCVDYTEFEDFDSYNKYKEFKHTHLWWHEDMLSEKLFKCVILKRPFIRLGMTHSLKRFKEWGFKTFDGVLFDESYDDMEDFYDRLNCILPQVEQYIDMPFDQLKKKVYSDEVQEIIVHNYNLAYEIYNNKEGEINV